MPHLFLEIRNFTRLDGAEHCNFPLLDQHPASAHSRSDRIPGIFCKIPNVQPDFSPDFGASKRAIPAPTSPPRTKGENTDRSFIFIPNYAIRHLMIGEQRDAILTIVGSTLSCQPENSDCLSSVTLLCKLDEQAKTHQSKRLIIRSRADVFLSVPANILFVISQPLLSDY